MAEIRMMSVQQALEWAFGREYARLDLDEDDRLGLRRFAVGTEVVIAERMALGGVRIDISRGRSHPHDDADAIAGIVARQPAAVDLYICARTGRPPDWMPGVAPKIEPMEWRRRNRFGQMAKTKVIRRGVREVVTPHPKNPARKVVRHVHWVEEVCPITCNPHPQEIDGARQVYLDWWAGLDEVRKVLRDQCLLRTIRITDEMPPEKPWESPAE